MWTKTFDQVLFCLYHYELGWYRRHWWECFWQCWRLHSYSKWGMWSTLRLYNCVPGSVLSNYYLNSFCSNVQGDLTSPKYALSRAAVEADTGLRILVALTVNILSCFVRYLSWSTSDIHLQQEGPEVNHRAQYEAWALENGFEYVEINTLDPVKGTTSCVHYKLIFQNLWEIDQRSYR